MTPFGQSRGFSYLQLPLFRGERPPHTKPTGMTIAGTAEPRDVVARAATDAPLILASHCMVRSLLSILKHPFIHPPLVPALKACTHSETSSLTLLITRSNGIFLPFTLTSSKPPDIFFVVTRHSSLPWTFLASAYRFEALGTEKQVAGRSWNGYAWRLEHGVGCLMTRYECAAQVHFWKTLRQMPCLVSTKSVSSGLFVVSPPVNLYLLALPSTVNMPC